MYVQISVKGETEQNCTYTITLWSIDLNKHELKASQEIPCPFIEPKHS